MRLVLDTNVLVAAMRSPSGASARMLDAVRDRRVTPVVNVSLVLEYEAVLTRPAQLAAMGLTASDIYRALDAFVSVAALADGRWRDRPQLRDADDDRVLEAAVNGQAEAIVTFELRTFAAAVSTHGIHVLTPAQAYGKVSE